MTRVLLFLTLFSGLAIAQQQTPVSSLQPDCQRFFSLGAVGFTTAIDVHGAACTKWVLTYASSGYSAISLLVESSLDAAGGASPAGFVAFAGTVDAGVNPNTAVNGTQTVTQLTGFYPWVRVNLTAKTGSGVVIGSLQGWKIEAGSGGGGGGGGGCTGVAPCVVIGPDAPGVAPTQDPVQIGGTDGAAVRRIVTNAGGGLLPGALATTVPNGDADSSPTVRGVDAAGVPQTTRTIVRPYLFNGATWDKAYTCTKKLTFNLSGSGNTEVIPLSGILQIGVCSISLATGSTENIKFTSGTGANCVTGTADETGLMIGVQALAFDYLASQGLFRLPAGAAMCINQSVAQATGGTVLYDYFTF